MSKILIIYAHPSHDGHHGYFLDKAIEEIEKNGWQYSLIDLYAINYDPVLRENELYSAGRRELTEQNQAFQEQIKNCERLLFIYPTWWNNMPAILKGWLDRVFTSRFGFVYKFGLPVGQLKGKKAAVFSASGAPRIYTRFLTNERSTKVLTHDLLRFCGIKSRTYRLGQARRLNEERKNKIERLSRRAVRYLVY